MEGCGCQPRNARDGWPLSEAGKEGFYPESQSEHSLLTPGFPISSLQNWKTRNVCCFKTLSLWYFGTTALEYTIFHLAPPFQPDLYLLFKNANTCTTGLRAILSSPDAPRSLCSSPYRVYLEGACSRKVSACPFSSSGGWLLVSELDTT